MMIMVPVMIGMAGLAIEYGNGMVTKVSNQRIADAAAFAGAVAYGKASNPAAIAPAVYRVGALAGVPASAMAISSGISPRNNGNSAVQVIVTTTVPLYFSRLVGSSATLAVASSSSAEITADVPGCIFALAPTGTGITLSGGTMIQAPNCSGASNSTLSAPCGTMIKAKSLSYDSGTVPYNPCGGLQTATGAPAALVRKAVADPVADNAAIKLATDRLALVAAMTAPSAPAAVPVTEAGFAIDFAYNPASTQNQAIAMGCTAAFASPVWTLTCPAGTTKVMTSVTQGGGLKVKWNPSGSGSNIFKFKQTVLTGGNGYEFGKGTYIFGGDLRTSGSGQTTFEDSDITINGDLYNGSSNGMVFGNGNLTVAKGVTNAGSGAMSFGAGTVRIGDSSIVCGAGYYSLCTTNGPIVFNGSSAVDSIFSFSSGVYVTGGATARFATATARNSYRVGKSSNGNSLTGLGGSSTFFGEVKPGSGLFEMSGKLDFAGGSCLAFPPGDNHDINSSFDTAGGVIFGKGTYTFNGYLAFGRAGGGAGNCDGVSTTVRGTDVTFVVSGLNNILTGTCASSSFCIAAGYSGVSLEAPLDGPMARMLVIGPKPGTNATGALFGEGGSSVNLSGLFYYPAGPITLGGGAGIGDKTGQCLTLIGSEVSMTGGTVVASSCINGAVGGGAVVLIR